AGAVGGAVLENRPELSRLGQRRKRGALALLGRLDRMGAQALQVQPLDDRPAAPHRPKARDAELGRLLHQPVDPPPLDRREEEPEIGNRLALAKPLADHQRRPLLPRLSDLREPFAAAIVEQLHLVPRRETKDSAQIGALDSDARALSQRMINEQARQAVRWA